MVFSSTEQLSCTLQGKDTTIQEAKGAAMLAKSHLKRQRNDDAFEKIYEFVVKESQDLTKNQFCQGKRKSPGEQSKNQIVTIMKLQIRTSGRDTLKFWMSYPMKYPEDLIRRTGLSYLKLFKLYTKRI